MFCTGASQVSLGREPQGSLSEFRCAQLRRRSIRALIHLPEGTKWRTLLVSIAEQVFANAHFLSPTTSPLVNPSWLCYPALMSVRSPLLPCSALFLTASQTHAVTQPSSACLLTVSPMGPSAFIFTLCSPPTHNSSLWQISTKQGTLHFETHLPATAISVANNASSHLALCHTKQVPLYAIM